VKENTLITIIVGNFECIRKENRMEVGIIGFGWLGSAIYENCVAHNISIKVGVRSNANFTKLKADKRATFLLEGEDFLEIPHTVGAKLTHLILCFPPPKTVDSGEYAAQLEALCRNLSPDCKIIFTSSTSVYPDDARNATEEYEFSEERIKSHPILLAENRLIESFGKNFTIFRLGGLVGGARQPANYLAGKNLQHPNSVVNLVGKDDVVAAVSYWLNFGLLSNLYNLVCPLPVTRAIYYSQAIERLKLEQPIIFSEDMALSKSIDGSKIEMENDFKYINQSALDLIKTIPVI
jgi:nucleoside-diphosphate-sugar epimerase